MNEILVILAFDAEFTYVSRKNFMAFFQGKFYNSCESGYLTLKIYQNLSQFRYVYYKLVQLVLKLGESKVQIHATIKI